jgi:glutathione S-transferase
MRQEPPDAAYRFIEDPARRRLALDAFTPEQQHHAYAYGERPAPPPQAQSIVFYDFPSSPFCIKVRAMLQHKGLRFSAVDALQPRRWWALRKRGPGKVPALEIGHRFVADSTDIAYELERLYPAAPLLPGNARERALCHALEEWADEAIYFIALHYLWLHPRSLGKAQRLFGSGPLAWLGYRFYLGMVRRQVHGQGTGRKTPAHIERDLLRHLRSAEALLEGHDFLLGSQPWLCDFALFGQLAFLLRTRASRELVCARPVLVRYVDRMRAMAA